MGAVTTNAVRATPTAAFSKNGLRSAESPRLASTLTDIRGELTRRQTDPKILADKLDPALDALKSVVDAVGQALKKVAPK